MPAGDVRPRRSQAPVLGAGAIAEYREAGWDIGAAGLPGIGMVTGPCARCHRRDHVRYGPRGSPLCPDCRPPAPVVPLRRRTGALAAPASTPDATALPADGPTPARGGAVTHTTSEIDMSGSR